MDMGLRAKTICVPILHTTVNLSVALGKSLASPSELSMHSMEIFFVYSTSCSCYKVLS